MEINRGTLALVNGSDIGLVIRIIDACGIKKYEIECSSPEVVLQTITDIVGLWQVTQADSKKSSSKIFAKYLPLIIANLANKIANFNRAFERLTLS
jgi:hypothetical protein